ncbi:MAG: hypothetical protein A3I12_03365 [Gammaproteobacteria bacterium RIFCSPLOWO2_02_FULL_38_11]|nr:MAG: hypothetical protein A3B69_00030 [Gammaproteobacteria bacterium RIFCSPHIGHO2_02_FULL_38_33]OGT24574.1 MAG: hypothetical protein A2W47_02810 [Gammaproteobacteria bacterium RIFCSPHIGHO2_12_38_15]OGT66719.1 MAG: hypothetical protein A3I12_03365 [Gammaproteobacteria bacterium RIFCSPLOWO2_02_FULL_38_11]OGT77355.1 MAG: hypothetical protein A3G71_00890 [Gammaproteobacteria bacterium RIFCSPLOWO2_12_FULL_38_14]
MNSKLNYLNALGILCWVKRTLMVSPSVACEIEFDWEGLQSAVKSCVACPLHKTRTQTVFGMGNPQSPLMLIGEGPGANEDLQGLPFVGRAGQLLNAMLKAIQLDRDKVYIANVIKCRAPKNRDPLPEEISSCTPFLEKQIQTIKPRLIVALGRVAAHYLLKTKSSMAQLRGKVHSRQGIPLIVTYHPAYLLRNPIDKAQALKDIYCIRDFLNSHT